MPPPADLRTPAQAAAWLCTPEAIRERSNQLLVHCLSGLSAFFTVDLTALGGIADRVAAVTLATYPDLRVPTHSRWRHFEAGGVDRWARFADRQSGADPAEQARMRIDLCVVSVLLDAGAGPDWVFVEPETGRVFRRSEGLAVASLGAFAAGVFSGDGSPRVDADGLEALDEARLAAAFQVRHDNHLVGLPGRVGLLHRLAAALRGDATFAGLGRPGGLYDRLASPALTASVLFKTLLASFSSVWPARLTLGGVALGDVWRHPALVTDDATSLLIPFHKLTQWLTYSLIEIFEEAGRPVRGGAALTGLPEYRNGGLLLDGGALRLRDDALRRRVLPPGHEAVVEWRALTVALLDRLAPLVRERLGPSAAEMPLASILEGGTWSAGRALAAELRPGGGPPLQVESDGTVF